MKIIIKNLQKKIPINPQRIKKTALKVLSTKRNINSGEITICFVSDKKIRGLNLKYLKKNNPTDVLAFDSSAKKGEISADIAISTDTAIKNAVIFHTTPLFELYLYVIHGVLHILGYTDKNKRDRDLMRQKEKLLLKALNLSPITYNL